MRGAGAGSLLVGLLFLGAGAYLGPRRRRRLLNSAVLGAVMSRTYPRCSRGSDEVMLSNNHALASACVQSKLTPWRWRYSQNSDDEDDMRHEGID